MLYQINTRQFTPEGTFRAAQRELPRLKAPGVDILWLMPIHPIGEKHRKGTLGSPYAVRDYYGVNPEFGPLGDLKAFVDAAHTQGMRVILDWMANHPAWDNPLGEQHPEWYARDTRCRHCDGTEAMGVSGLRVATTRMLAALALSPAGRVAVPDDTPGSGLVQRSVARDAATRRHQSFDFDRVAITRAPEMIIVTIVQS